MVRAIQVHASFPHAVAPGSDLNLDPTNWHWIHCLTLPLETLDALQFSLSPYKWIRYAIGVVVGAEGDLSSSPDFPSVVDYDAGLPADSTSVYYHTSDEEKRRMFPADPNIGRTHVTSSVATTRRVQFRDDVAERDGGRCVVTEMPEILCDAVHLLAHSKSDAYIATYTQRRSRDPTGGDIVRDIDSLRNGLLLNKLTHSVFGIHVAFLMTPNFAMNATDIDPNATPEEKRCIAHLFRPDQPFFLGGPGAPPSGTSLRISDSPEWPPAILFDAVYAGTVLHHFGTQVLKDRVTATWKDSFYPGGVMNTADTEYKANTDGRAAAAQRTQHQAQERQERYEARRRPDTLDMLIALPYIRVPPNELQAMLRESKAKAEEAEKRRVHEKVETWMKQITAA